MREGGIVDAGWEWVGEEGGGVSWVRGASTGVQATTSTVFLFEGGALRPTVPWRPFRAVPDGHQGRAHRAFSNGPHRGKQEHKTHNGMCTG